MPKLAMILCLLVCGPALCQGGSQDVLPGALRAALSERQSIATYRLEWLHEQSGAGTPHSRLYLSMGAIDGSRLRRELSAPRPANQPKAGDGAPQPALLKGVLRHADGSCSSYQSGRDSYHGFPPGAPGAAPVPDPRYLGLGLELLADAEEDAVWGGIRSDLRKSAVFSEETRADLVIVTARLAGGARVEWVVNSLKGWNVERVRVLVGDETQRETVSLLKSYDGVWFPEAVTTYVDGQLASAVQVRGASFNAPEHPQRLTETDLGIEPGMERIAQGAGAGSQPRMLWNGTRLVSREDFEAAVRRGEAQFGPTVLAWKQHVQRSGTPANERPDILLRAYDPRASIHKKLSLWEQYTESFIERFKLGDDQTQKARQILKECQDRANSLIDRRKTQIEEFYQRVEALRRPESTDEDTWTRIRREEKKAIGFLDEIFSDELCPKLDALPSRAQRESAASSAPSKR